MEQWDGPGPLGFRSIHHTSQSDDALTSLIALQNATNRVEKLRNMLAEAEKEVQLARAEAIKTPTAKALLESPISKPRKKKAASKKEVPPSPIQAKKRAETKVKADGGIAKKPRPKKNQKEAKE